MSRSADLLSLFVTPKRMKLYPEVFPPLLSYFSVCSYPSTLSKRGVADISSEPALQDLDSGGVLPKAASAQQPRPKSAAPRQTSPSRSLPTSFLSILFYIPFIIRESYFGQSSFRLLLLFRFNTSSLHLPGFSPPLLPPAARRLLLLSRLSEISPQQPTRQSKK